MKCENSTGRQFCCRRTDIIVLDDRSVNNVHGKRLSGNDTRTEIKFTSWEWEWEGLESEPTFSKLLRKILERLLILGKS